MVDFENNDMINEEEVLVPEVVDDVETETEGSGINTGAAMLIGAGLTLATTAAIKLGKKLWSKIQEKRALKKCDEDEPVEPTDEQIAYVSTPDDSEK